MKILIVTDHFHTIEADFILSLEDSDYRIKVKEISPGVRIIQSSIPTMGTTNSSDEALGFEDVNEVAATVDMDANESRRNDTSPEQALEVVQETQSAQSNSKETPRRGRPGDSLGESVHSSTKAKIACFSQNGYSEEIIKVLQHLSTLEDEEK